MATKTISLKVEAYERLRAARRDPNESFSQVVMRARWNRDTITGAGLLERMKRRGPAFSEASLDRIEAVKRGDLPAEDKWKD